MKKSFIASLTSIIGFFLLFSTNASAEPTISGAKEGVGNLTALVTVFTEKFVSALGTLMLAAAVVAFFWGVVQYVWGVREGKEDKIKAGNQFMLWGLIALFVMFSVYGIIQVAQSLIPNLDKTTIKIPRIDFGTSGGPSSDSGNKADPFAVPATPMATCPDGTRVSQADLKYCGSSASQQTRDKYVAPTSNSAFDNCMAQGGERTEADCRNATAGQSPNFIPTKTSTSDASCAGQGGVPQSDGSCDMSGVSSNSPRLDALNAYIKDCKAKDSNKNGTQCWREYSAQNPINNTGKNCANGAVDMFGDCVADFCTNNPNNPACLNGGLDSNTIPN